MPDITITITTAQTQRIQDAFTVALELGAPATQADIKNYLIDHMKNVVMASERRVHDAAHSAGDDLDLT